MILKLSSSRKTRKLTNIWKINRETEALNDTIGQIDLIDIYRTFHPKTADYMLSQVCMEHSPG